jgi:membrane protein
LAAAIQQAARSVYALLRETYENWRADRAIRLGAGLAYYAVFAAVPLLTSAVAIAGVIFSEAEIQAFLTQSLEAILIDVPGDVRGLVDNVAGTIDRSATSSALTTFSVLLGVFAASLLFIALQDAFNVIWKIPVESGFRFTMRRRLVAFAVVLLVGLALIATLAVQTVALVVDEVFGGSIGNFLNLDDLVVSAATWAVGVCAIAVLFQLLISEHLNWRSTFVVAALIAVMMVIGTWGVGIYFSRSGSTSLAAVSGGAVILLTWLYYLAQILIAGAELLKTLESRSQAATTS